MALNYTLLGERAEVTRQTIYRHWPSPTALLAELVLTGPDVDYPTPDTDPGVVATDFLKSLRAGMNDPTTAATLMALTAHADHDASSAGALATVAQDRRGALNTLLAGTGRSVTADEFARLVGPVLFQRFFARQPVTDQLIQSTVAAWLDHPTPSGPASSVRVEEGSYRS
jgi:AcrR family transcriptional regulator